MKKFLLIAACFFGLTAMAEETTLTMTDAAAVINGSAAEATWSKDGFTITVNKESGTTNPTVNANGKDLRLYAKGTLTVSTNVPITSISFALSTQGLKRIGDVTPSAGAIAEQGANPLVWNGSANSVTFTVGEKAVYGTDGASKAAQFDFLSMTIVTDGNPEGGETPNPDPQPGDNGIIYKGLVDNADDWEPTTYWPEDDDVAIWKWDEKYKQMKATGYIDGAAQETEAVVYSPLIDLTEYKDVKLTFDHALNYLDLSKYDREWFLEVVACDDEAAMSEDEDAGVYEYLDVPVWPDGKNWTFVNSGDVDLSAFDGKWMLLYFYYYSGPTEEQTEAFEAGEIDEEDLVNVAGTWEIKNFVITGSDSSGVRQVIFDSNAPVEYFNLNGVRVDNPKNGIYVRRHGNTATKVVVK